MPNAFVRGYDARCIDRHATYDASVRRREVWQKHHEDLRRLRIRAVETGDPELRRLLDRGKDEVRLVTRRDVAPRLSVFRFTKPAGFAFVPGQYVRLALGGRRRPFSIASAPHEPFLEFFAEHVEGGAFTTPLFAMREGDRLRIVGEAKGEFRFDEERRAHLMIATVTGIAPFVSMLRAAAVRGTLRRDRIVVLHGASTMDAFGYDAELMRLPIVYVRSITRPEDPRNAGFRGPIGRLDAVARSFLREHPADPTETTVYACGHPEMVRAVKQDMQVSGFRVRTETFTAGGGT